VCLVSVPQRKAGGTMTSTRDLSRLPDVKSLRRNLQAMALLDAILCPQWDLRYYSFSSTWAPGEEMGSMRNGSGDDFFAHFSAAGCWLKGFDHESPMSPYAGDEQRQWPGVIDAVPDEFAACLQEPAFKVKDVTFCIWRRYSDPAWQVGPVEFPPGHGDPDGSSLLLQMLDGRPESYRDWARSYYEHAVNLAAVECIYRHDALTAEIVENLNPAISLADLAADIREIGYPSQG
ncbi:MAG: hypothetical protein ACRD4Q_12775, partial [Candidatus Acidiferrales bacterium]